MQLRIILLAMLLAFASGMPPMTTFINPSVVALSQAGPKPVNTTLNTEMETISPKEQEKIGGAIAKSIIAPTYLAMLLTPFTFLPGLALLAGLEGIN